MSETILEVKNLKTYFYVDGNELHAVDGISYDVKKGECVAIVGESASGKSVSSLSIMRLVAYPPGVIAGGEVIFDGTDLLKLSENQMRAIRGNRISMVFQEPGTSLNPVLTVGRQLTEGIRMHRGISKQEANREAVELMSLVGIPNPEQRMKDYPYQFSGGMQQRIMIAMAMMCRPDLLIADEPTTALDVTVQAQVLDVLGNLRRQFGTAVIIITHNLGVVARYADRVNVMYAGRIMESGSAEDIFERPAHPYTRGLLNAVPRLDLPADQELIGIPGNPPQLAELKYDSCPFAARCQEVCEVCFNTRPAPVTVGEGHTVSCFLAAKAKEGDK